MRVPVVGILGGIGSGKSTVVRQVEDLRLQIIDADRIGHDLLSAPGILDQLRAAFDSSIFDDADEITAHSDRFVARERENVPLCNDYNLDRQRQDYPPS